MGSHTCSMSISMSALTVHGFPFLFQVLKPIYMTKPVHHGYQPYSWLEKRPRHLLQTKPVKDTTDRVKENIREMFLMLFHPSYH